MTLLLLLLLLGDVDCQRHERPEIEREPIDSIVFYRCISWYGLDRYVELSEPINITEGGSFIGEPGMGRYIITNIHFCYDHDRCESEENSWRKWKCRAY